ncbi:amine oxidase [Mucilaginibacter corticis]|uniref:Amine oxidase n=1 Tax=Mucilaginibacter corticis TaxID=2597670 RepID=A0A556M8V3_9SPHI|nr:amine oxidase [Mucilaginibacter corticis]TSJ36320.1 amine oxidase [Mucilaginibacter corticis]
MNNPLKSFWMGGFESADHLNAFGDRVDFLELTRHLQNIDSDYECLSDFAIGTVREGIRWSQIERAPYRYDFSVVKIMLRKGRKHRIQQIWDICHFGFPDDLTPLHPHFTARFTGVCKAFVELFLQECPGEILIVTPINEVSFISWLGGEVKGTSPYGVCMGWEVKYALMRAYIAGIKAMKEIMPVIRILSTEPLVNVVPPLFCSAAERSLAESAHSNQFQSIDILTGALCPELGGSPDLLDILGFNYYYNNQWIFGTGEFLKWANEDLDPRWQPFSQLLTEAFLRYRKPVVLTETSHPGKDRPKWIEFISKESGKAISDGVPLWGICLYPIIDRPDWDDTSYWHHSGLWDEHFLASGERQRVLVRPYADALKQAQKMIFQYEI